jgi:hypothetical protein
MRKLGLLTLLSAAAMLLGCPSSPSPPEKICREFARLKTRGEATANNLLGPAPSVPSEPVSPEEAQRLQTEFWLRGDFEITDVWSTGGQPDGQSATYTLVTKGTFPATELKVRTPDGIDVVNRSMAHADLFVEVKDGKIYGVRADLHVDPNQRPMSKAEAERLKRILLPRQ